MMVVSGDGWRALGGSTNEHMACEYTVATWTLLVANVVRKLKLIQMELPTKLLRLLTFKDETNGLLLRVINCLVRLRRFERVGGGGRSAAAERAAMGRQGL